MKDAAATETGEVVGTKSIDLRVVERSKATQVSLINPLHWIEARLLVLLEKVNSIQLSCYPTMTSDVTLSRSDQIKRSDQRAVKRLSHSSLCSGLCVVLGSKSIIIIIARAFQSRVFRLAAFSEMEKRRWKTKKKVKKRRKKKRRRRREERRREEENRHSGRTTSSISLRGKEGAKSARVDGVVSLPPRVSQPRRRVLSLSGSFRFGFRFSYAIQPTSLATRASIGF